MSIFVIADLHLSFSENKPMDIFGENWNNHAEKIKENWINQVKQDDVVVLPGDFSWAMHLEDTYEDFKFLNELPGTKILLKGNHDYWWTTIKSMKNYLKENNFEKIEFLHNNAIMHNNIIICGTRGWSFTETENSKKMINRENERLILSLKDGIDKYGEDKEKIVFMHYPPCYFGSTSEEIGMKFINTMQEYNVKKCYYGHLHGNSHKDAIEGEVKGIQLKLISADFLDFKLYKNA